MSAKEISFENGGLTWMNPMDADTERLEFTEVDGRRWHLDRDQSMLLKLYLQEHMRLKLRFGRVDP